MTINLTKKDIIKKFNSKIGFSSNYSKKLVEDILEILTLNIKSGYFNLKNVGSFKIIHKNERIGRNPKTKKKYIISSRKTVSFTASNKISDNLNKYL